MYALQGKLDELQGEIDRLTVRMVGLLSGFPEGLSAPAAEVDG